MNEMTEGVFILAINKMALDVALLNQRLKELRDAQMLLNDFLIAKMEAPCQKKNFT